MTEYQPIYRTIMEEAISVFNHEEQYLIINDLSERCICARLAMHLTNILKKTRFHDYVVDVEYNRGSNGLDNCMKQLGGSLITVDLIVHKRGQNQNCCFDNLICVEMKKDSHIEEIKSDEERLCKMTAPSYHFCYHAGFMIVIDHLKNALCIKSEFQNGSCYPDSDIQQYWKNNSHPTINLYHKLVRDRIPEIIETSGRTCVTEILSDDEYLKMIDSKLDEELAEYHRETNHTEQKLEELADLQEVIYAAAIAQGYTLEDLERVRAEKAQRRGSFERKILLIEVKED